MTCNVGRIEWPIRILLGILMLGIGAFVNLPPIGTGLVLVLGSIALVTGVIGYCPLWAFLGMNTCPTRMSKKP